MDNPHPSLVSLRMQFPPLADGWARNHLGQPSNHWLARKNRFLSNLEDTIMSRTNGRNSKNFSPGEFVFVDVRLSKSDQADFLDWCLKDAKDNLQVVAQLIGEGFKTSLSWDVENVCFIASCTCRVENDPRYNHCVTSRSDDWMEAILLNSYKIHKLMTTDDWLSPRAGNNWG